jgi:DNA-binding response OmpR family regulator
MTSAAPTPSTHRAIEVEALAAASQFSRDGAFEGVYFERFEDVIIGPPRVTKPQRNLLVLSDDEVQREVIRQCASSLDCIPVFLSDGLLFISTILKPYTSANNHASPDAQPEIHDLIVVGGSTPGWVQMEMSVRIVTACKAQNRKAPAILFLLMSSDVPSFKTVLEIENLDFLQCPLNAPEFEIRMKRLSALHQTKASAVYNSNKGDGRHSDRFLEAPPATQSARAFDPFASAVQGSSAQSPSPVTSTWGSYAFDVRNQQVSIRGEVKYLPLREFSIAFILFTNMNQTVTYDELISKVFTRTRMDEKDRSRLLGSYVSRLRTMLALSDEGQYKLLAIYRVGYMVKSKAT